MKRAILLIVGLLMALLIACTTMPAQTSGSADLQGAAGNSTVQDVSWATEDIKDAIVRQEGGAELEILDTSKIGVNLVLVDYFLPSSTNRYALYYTQTKTVDLLPVQDVELQKSSMEITLFLRIEESIPTVPSALCRAWFIAFVPMQKKRVRTPHRTAILLRLRKTRLLT